MWPFPPQQSRFTKPGVQEFSRLRNGSSLSPSAPLCCWGRLDAPERVSQPPLWGPERRGPAAATVTAQPTKGCRTCWEPILRATPPGRPLPGSCRVAGSSSSPGSYSSRSSWSGSNRGHTRPQSVGHREQTAMYRVGGQSRRQGPEAWVHVPPPPHLASHLTSPAHWGC